MLTLIFERVRLQLPFNFDFKNAANYLEYDSRNTFHDFRIVGGRY